MSLQEQVFKNKLVLEKILSFVEFAEVKRLRLVSKSFDKEGKSYLKRNRENVYLKLKDAHEVGAETENERTLNWAVLPENQWLIKQLRIPIQETIRSRIIVEFLSNYGHLTTHLKLFRQETFKYANLEQRSAHLNSPVVYNVVKSWCPNLEYLSVIDRYTPFRFKDFPCPKFTLNNLVFLELDGCDNPSLPILRWSFVVQLILNSPNLVHLKIMFRCFEGIGTLKEFRRVQDFTSNIEVLEQGNGVDALKLDYLTEERFPRLRKLIINSEREGCCELSKSPPPAVHSGVKEVVWTGFRHFNHYFPIFFSLFPSVQSLTVGNVRRYFHPEAYPFPVFFPSIKNLSIKCDQKLTLFTSKIIREMVKLMPRLERLQISGIEDHFYLKLLAKGVEGAESVRELDLCLGANHENWFKQEDADRFPKRLRLFVHD